MLLGPVDGAVGEPDQLVSAVTLHRERRETRADGDLTDVVEVDGRDPLDDRLRRGQRRRLVMVGEQQRELVSSEAERLSTLTEPRRDLREHTVPRRVSEAVVDPLEVVDVHQAERQRACLLFGVQQLALQSLVEVAVVAEAGEGIREREPHRAERAVGRALVEGDCEQRSDERDRKHRRALPEHDQHQRCRGHERERDDRRAHVCLHQF